MRHFPIFLDLDGERVVVSGAGDVAAAKLRLLLKTNAAISVFGDAPSGIVEAWAADGLIDLRRRSVEEDDCIGARLVYATNGEAEADARAAEYGRRANALVNVVDKLDDCDFITPAIVDRDPVTVAIGTEGAAPVLARRIKADLEARLSAGLGTLAAIARGYRLKVGETLSARARRDMWSRYFDGEGQRALDDGGTAAARRLLEGLIRDHEGKSGQAGHVSIIGAGPGDPELLTLKARRVLDQADVVIHDRLVPAAILELARREATIIEVGKRPDGKSWKQRDINTLMVAYASGGASVVRLKSGDPAVFGRLDEEMDALDEAGIAFDIVPGITSAIAAAAEIKVSLTRRGRNSALRILTGHDVDGFAEQDWRNLSHPGTVAAIYMGVRAARFVQGRLMLHGAVPETPITVIENVSREGQKTVSATLGTLVHEIETAGVSGPAIIFVGLAPRSEITVRNESNIDIKEALL